MSNTNTKVSIYSMCEYFAEQIPTTEEQMQIDDNEDTMGIPSAFEEDNAVDNIPQVIKTVIPFNSTSLKI